MGMSGSASRQIFERVLVGGHRQNQSRPEQGSVISLSLPCPGRRPSPESEPPRTGFSHFAFTTRQGHCRFGRGENTISGMISSNCGHQHENARGECPFCTFSDRRALPRRQFKCIKCGGEVTFVAVPKDGQALDVPVHVSSITIACPDSK